MHVCSGADEKQRTEDGERPHRREQPRVHFRPKVKRVRFKRNPQKDRRDVRDVGERVQDGARVADGDTRDDRRRRFSSCCTFAKRGPENAAHCEDQWKTKSCEKSVAMRRMIPRAIHRLRITASSASTANTVLHTKGRPRGEDARKNLPARRVTKEE